MEFYYQKELDALSVKCPPESYQPVAIKCYRWVFDVIADDKNFKAQAEKNPKIINDKNDGLICECYALSFHITAQASQDHFKLFASKSPLAYKRLGTHIAEGQLEYTDGVSGRVEPNGHFNFHPVKDHRFEHKFTIVKTL